MIAAVPFVGRRKERAWLDEHLAALDGGRSAVALVAGPPGVGKTRLVRTALGARPHLWARSWEFGEAPALWPVAQMLRALDRLRPGTVDPDRDRLRDLLEGERGSAGSLFALQRAFADCVLRGAEAGPLVLVVDDLHAADRATLELLLAAQTHWRDAPVLLLATRRSVDARTRPDAARLIARLAQLADECHLPGLEREEVRELADALSRRSLREDEVDALMARAGGLPLFVEGLVLAAHGGRIAPSADTGGLPRPLRAALEDRVDQLPVGVQVVLARAALVPGRLDAAVLARSLDLPRGDVEDALGRACEEGLLVRRDDGLAWSHQILAEAVAAAQGAAGRRAGHRALLATLDPSPATLAARAHHAQAADLPEAGPLLTEAAKVAESMHAHQSAADLFGQAAQATTDPTERCDALLARARALRRAGEGKAAREALEGARRTGLPDRAAEYACALAEGVPFGVGDPCVVATLREALDSLGSDQHARRAAVLSHLAWQELQVDPDRGLFQPLIDEALAAAEASGEPAVLLQALTASMRYWRADRLPIRARTLRRLSELRPLLRRPEERLEVSRWEFNTAMELCDGAAARRALRAHEQDAETVRTPQARQSVLIRRSILLQLEGRADEVDAEALRREGERAADPHAEFFAVSPGLLPALLRGDEEPVRTHRDLVVRTCREAWAHFPGVVLLSAWIQLVSGDLDSAAAAYREWKADDFRRPPWWGHLQGLCTLAQIALALEDREGAAVLVERLREYPDGYGGCGPIAPFGPVARFEARLLSFLGRDEEAEVARTRALRLCDRLGAPAVAAQIWREAEEERADRAGGRGASSRAPAPAPQGASGIAAEPVIAEMVDEGGVWAFRMGDRIARVRRARGFEHLATLLERPGEPVHVLELTSGQRRAEVDGDAGEVLDGTARRAYAERARALYADLQEAETHCDLGRIERLTAELDALTEQLASATGLGGRSRVAASAFERARVAVKQAIRRALGHLRLHLPELAHHLEQAVRTGALCCYAPTPGGLRVTLRRTPSR